MDPGDATEPAELRDGRYVLVRPLGEGAQGETFEAVDKREGKLVAIKRLRVNKAKSWKDVELAEREARILAALDHPLLPKYIEHFEENGALYLVMERIEGDSLHARRKAGKRSRPEDVVAMLQDADRALSYMHGLSPPVIHRDLKPGNVIERPDGTFAFVDFGSVRDRLRPEGGSTVAGTFGYMAPEQFQGRALPASDVYGVGATALAMLTGREPEELPHRGLAIAVARAVPSGTPKDLVRVLEAMLAPNPDERASSVGEALRHLSRTSSRDRRRAESKRDGRDRRKAEKKRRRRDRRPVPVHVEPNVPLIFRFFGILGLRVAQIAVIFAVGVFVPILLVALSVLFGPALRRAARATRRASGRAYRSIDRAAAHVSGARISEDVDASAEEQERVRVSATEEPRTRVVEAAEPDDLTDDEAWDEEAEEREHRRTRR